LQPQPARVAGMIRRNARLRREYLYRKSLEGKEREEYERKRKVREALDGGARARPLLSLGLPAWECGPPPQRPTRGS